MILINKTDTMKSVPIVFNDGKKDSINVQGRSRAELPENAKVDPTHQAVVAKVFIFKS